MNKNKTYLKLFTRFWPHLSKQHQKNFILIIFLMIIVAIAETFTIASVIPFLGVIAAPEKVFNLEVFQGLISYLDLTSPNQIVLPITIIFASAAIFAGLMRGFLLWSTIKFSF